MKSPHASWKVDFGWFYVTLWARSPGNAFRKAVRLAIAAGGLKRQPRTVPGGGGRWSGVSISRVALCRSMPTFTLFDGATSDV